MDEKNLVSKDKALEHAIVRLLEGVATETLPEDWRGAVVQSEPVVIYDINGEPLFYEFAVEKDQKTLGRIKVAASKVLGPAVYAVHIGQRPWNPDEAMKQAKLWAEREHRSEKLLSTQIVCYNYPKIGILVVLGNARSGEETGRFILDAGTFKPIPKVYHEKDNLGVDILSMYESMSPKDKEQHISRWNTDDEFLDLFKKTAEKRKIDIKKKLAPEELKVVDEIFKNALAKDALGKSSYFYSKTLGLTLHGQEHCVWCACASGQMILKYHHYYYQQNEIAGAMGTNWSPANCYGGTSYSGAIAGLENLSHNYLDAFSQAPDWSQIRSQINNSRPFMSIVPGHARACGGYYHYVLDFGWFKFYQKRHLLIYDPWPGHTPNNTFCNPQGGDKYWEDFEVTTYWDYIFAKT